MQFRHDAERSPERVLCARPMSSASGSTTGNCSIPKSVSLHSLSWMNQIMPCSLRQTPENISRECRVLHSFTQPSLHQSSQPFSHHWLNPFWVPRRWQRVIRTSILTSKGWKSKRRFLGERSKICTKISLMWGRNRPVPLGRDRWIPTHFRKRNDFWFPRWNQDEIWWKRGSN